MKTLITLSFALIFVSANAQTGYPNGDPLHYEAVVKTDTSFKKAQLYSKGLEWFAKTFNSGKSVLQLQDAEAGVMIGNYVIICDVPYNEYMGAEGQIVKASIKISVKDGRIKYEIFDFVQPQYGAIKDGDWIDKGFGKGIRIKRYAQYLKDSKEKAIAMCKDITDYFTSKIATSSKDNW